MTPEVLLAAADAAAKAEPNNITWIGLGILLVGGIMTIKGVARNENKHKAGLAVVGLVIVLVGAFTMLYSN